MTTTDCHSMKATHRGTEAPRRFGIIHPRCLSVSVCRGFTSVALVLVVANAVGWLSVVEAQQLLDKVVARVGTTAITQTDVDAALAFGIVETQAGEPVKQMIDRTLMLAEVEKFRPPEPAEAAIAELVAKMKATAGAQAGAVMKRTGVDEKRLTELARATLRIQSYIQQRFGTSTRSEQQMARWLDDLRARGDVAEVSPQR